MPRILVTAGPTRESIDPIRYLSNHSTGEMGYAFAKAARGRGYQVTLISGPVGLKAPAGVKLVRIVSASDLQKACEKHFRNNDVIVMSAAVCDFRPQHQVSHKIKREKTLTLKLEKTPDIIANLAKRRRNNLVIGFCLETEDWLRRARLKLSQKKLDGIVANRLSKSYVPFGQVKAQMAFLGRNAKEVVVLKPQSKASLAKALLKWIETMHDQKAIQKN